MTVDPTDVFVGLTAGMWFVGVWRMTYRPHERIFTNFLLGVFVMSFVGIWISLI